jgi:phosphate acetyltransferase
MLSSEPVECPKVLLKKATHYAAVRTAIVKADQPLVMDSVKQSTLSGLIEPVLIGDREAIFSAATEVDWDISPYEVIDRPEEKTAAETGAFLARTNEIGALMKGHIHTDAFMGAIVPSKAGLRTDRRISHVFHMTLPNHDGSLMITDAAINIRPDIEAKKHILLNVVDLALAIDDKTPNVALLSATEEVNPKMPSSVQADELTAWWRQNTPHKAHVYGPLAFDNAISQDAARIKGIEHPVAGNADILVVPDIKTGNALFKMMVYFCSACAAGIVVGAKVPIILTSRADPCEARLASCALAALLAGNRSIADTVANGTLVS